MKKFLFLMAVMAVFSLSAFGAGRVVKLKPFEALQVATSVDVNYVVKQTSEPDVTITGPDEVISKLSVTMVGKTVKIAYKNLSGERLNTKDVKVILAAPPVADISVSSSAEVKVIGGYSLPGKTVRLAASSSGEISIPSLTAGDVNVAASSSADVKVKSLSVTSCNVAASSSADVELSAVTANGLSLAASSSADVDLSGIQVGSLSVAASSGADVELSGNVSGTADIVASSGADVSVKKLSASKINKTTTSGAKIR